MKEIKLVFLIKMIQNQDFIASVVISKNWLFYYE
jgi:hypothetical protein